MKSNKKIIVLGGGTAGWLTALFAKKFLSNNVTLIESKKIGRKRKTSQRNAQQRGSSFWWKAMKAMFGFQMRLPL